MKTLFARAATAAALFSPLTFSQGVIEPGFELTSSLANPAPFSTFVSLPDGSRVHFDGSAVTHLDGDGSFLQTLHVFPSFVFAGAIAADPTGDSVLIGESSNGEIYRVQMNGSGATHLATLPFNYSAAYQGPGVAYVSAAVCGWACGNDIIRLDTLSGAATTVAQVSGPSGPLAFDADGNLLYGASTDAFPAPPGSGGLWKFNQAELASGALLGDAHAEVLNTNIDPISSIAVDPVMGDIVVSTNLFDESFNVTSDQILLLRPNGVMKDLVGSASGGYRSHLELQSGVGDGHFRAYQPHGVHLTWLEGDSIHAVAPKRPSATVVHNGGGSYAFVVTGAEPNGAMLLTFGDSSYHHGDESAHQLAFDFLFHTGLPLNRIRRVGQFLMPCDALGTATFPFWDGGSLAGTIVFQGVITGPNGSFIGSSQSAFH